MKFKPVVTMKAGEARIVSTKRWRAFVKALNELDGQGGATARAEGQGEGPCGEYCETRGGVDLCGGSVVLCNNGEAAVIAG